MDIYYSYKLATVSVWTYITVTNWPHLVYGHILQLKKLATVSVWKYITVRNWPQLVYGNILQLKIGHS